MPRPLGFNPRHLGYSRSAAAVAIQTWRDQIDSTSPLLFFHFNEPSGNAQNYGTLGRGFDAIASPGGAGISYQQVGKISATDAVSFGNAGGFSDAVFSVPYNTAWANLVNFEYTLLAYYEPDFTVVSRSFGGSSGPTANINGAGLMNCTIRATLGFGSAVRSGALPWPALYLITYKWDDLGVPRWPRIFLNGVEVTYVTHNAATGLFLPCTIPLTIGNNDGVGNGWRGRIDEFVLRPMRPDAETLFEAQLLQLA
jgi:hypothetical protein